MKKQIFAMGHMQMYNNDAEFALKAKMVTSLAFTPFEDLKGNIDILSNELPEELSPLLN